MSAALELSAPPDALRRPDIEVGAMGERHLTGWIDGRVLRLTFYNERGHIAARFPALIADISLYPGGHYSGPELRLTSGLEFGITREEHAALADALRELRKAA